MKLNQPHQFFDIENPDLINFTNNVVGNETNPQEKAKLLYYAVRDQFLYNPFLIYFSDQENKASHLLKVGSGHCIAKASFLCCCLRIADIPAKLGMAKVRNHMGTAKLEEILQSDVLVPHGYTEVFLNGKWIKCTPAFNKQLCQKLGTHPLDWDGETDSIFHEYDREGGKFMEYLEDYGTFDDFPVEMAKALMQKEYPHLFDHNGKFLLHELLTK
ncbi:transglutaminase family protein [Persicobacter sp. CCB-QB2]|uniref:transglutaminase-like domain-containing protein n=1 Tax=Persicobacter sp. CCB-QB2 TaxID=1561025 RepID=UPI0006A97EBE|nr:transglutaminase-like domain-containing protein [Persicobacter sp. CCB-QB2]